MENTVIELSFPTHASAGRGDIVATTERRFTEEVQRVMSQKATEGLKLVSALAYRGILRLFFTTK
ncbi:MAG: hypothetical protein AAB613_00705 [Patescibacteria group bacterium]